MKTPVLNLSRKWRAHNFDHIIGQDTSIRILKNSLYLDHYFPVYLFAGQRGCGKTSTARVFAAALNCQTLPHFQKDPKKSSVPCLVCTSCVAMREGNHPDFIEIDAASHTGVDNIRTIIESSSLLPLLGRKRVYLIDEAHMLSKAAFNAALKILEEPAPTSLFILATTNHHKIIETVRSRCFQLFFTAIAHDVLQHHLRTICAQENIPYEDGAFDLIIKQTDGSARDAINLLEQTRFAYPIVSKESVLSLLGHMNDQDIATIIATTLNADPAQLLLLLQQISFDNYSAEYMWQQIMLLLRALVWMKYGINPGQLVASHLSLDSIAHNHSLDHIQRMVHYLYLHEETFLKTTTQHIFLEAILLDICQKLSTKPTLSHNEKKDIVIQQDTHQHNTQKKIVSSNENVVSPWDQFMSNIETIKDPLVISLFKQARFIQVDQKENKIDVEFSKDFIFFKEILHDTRTIWQPLLHQFFACGVLNPQFTAIHKKENSSSEKQQPVPPIIQQASTQSTHVAQWKRTPSYAHEVPLDLSDKATWRTATLLLHYFPGTITHIKNV